MKAIRLIDSTELFPWQPFHLLINSLDGQ